MWDQAYVKITQYDKQSASRSYLAYYFFTTNAIEKNINQVSIAATSISRNYSEISEPLLKEFQKSFETFQTTFRIS